MISKHHVLFVDLYQAVLIPPWQPHPWIRLNHQYHRLWWHAVLRNMPCLDRLRLHSRTRKRHFQQRWSYLSLKIVHPRNGIWTKLLYGCMQWVLAMLQKTLKVFAWIKGWQRDWVEPAIVLKLVYCLSHFPLFSPIEAQEITGDILIELTLNSLKELEVNTFGKRFRIHSAITALRAYCNIDVSHLLIDPFDDSCSLMRFRMTLISVDPQETMDPFIAHLNPQHLATNTILWPWLLKIVKVVQAIRPRQPLWAVVAIVTIQPHYQMNWVVAKWILAVNISQPIQQCGSKLSNRKLSKMSMQGDANLITVYVDVKSLAAHSRLHPNHKLFYPLQVVRHWTALHINQLWMFSLTWKDGWANKETNTRLGIDVGLYSKGPISFISRAQA